MPANIFDLGGELLAQGNLNVHAADCNIGHLILAAVISEIPIDLHTAAGSVIGKTCSHGDMESFARSARNESAILSRLPAIILAQPFGIGK